MTVNSAVKKRVRALMKAEGIKYTVALRRVLAEQGKPDPGKAQKG